MRLSQILLLCFSASLCAAAGGGGNSGPSPGATIPGNDRDDNKDDGSGLPAKKKRPPPAKQANPGLADEQSNAILDDPKGQLGLGNGAPARGQPAQSATNGNGSGQPMPQAETLDDEAPIGVGDDESQEPMITPGKGNPGASGAAKPRIPSQQGAGSVGAASDAGLHKAPMGTPSKGGSGAAGGAAKPRIPSQKGAGSGEGVSDADLGKEGPVLTPGKGKPGYLGTGTPAQQGAGGGALPADLSGEDPSLAGGAGGVLPGDGAAAGGVAMGDELAGGMGDGAAKGAPGGAPGKPEKPYKFAPKEHVIPCQASYGPRNGCGQCSDDLSQKPGEIDKAPFKKFDNPDFGSDEPGTRSGYLAWFSIPEPPRGCKTVVMVPTDNAQPAVGTVGVTIIAASKAGCYSGVFHQSGWATANCCNQDQCNLVAAGALTTRPIKKRESRLTRRETTSSELDDLESLKVDTHNRQTDRRNRLEKRFNFKENTDKPPSLDQAGCFPPNMTNPTPIQRAGTQQVNETDFKCTVNGAGACRAETGVTSTTTNSTMITNGQTDTKSKGNSVGITAGIQGFYPMGLGPTFSVTDTISEEVSKAIEKSLAKTDENGKTESWSFIQDMTDGTMGRMSWVPYLQCFGYTMQCKDGIKEFEHCRSKGPKEGYTLLIYTG